MSSSDHLPQRRSCERVDGLVVLVFAAAHQGRGVWLIGDSNRWAAAAILLLGIVTCSLGSPAERPSRILIVLGVAALALAVVVLVTGSLTVLSLLVLDVVVLWTASTWRHGLHRESQASRKTPLTHQKPTASRTPR